jgi:hypothetical protein
MAKSDYKPCCCDTDGDSFCDLHAATKDLLAVSVEALALLDRIPYLLREQIPDSDWDVRYRLADAIAKARGSN